MKRSIFAFVMLLNWSLALGQSTLSNSNSNPDQGLGTEASDVRINVTNALITTLQNSRQFTMDLRWDYLPDNPDVAALKAIYNLTWDSRGKLFSNTQDGRNVLWGEWTIRNRDLTSPDGWRQALKKMSLEDRRFLASVLNGGTPTHELDDPQSLRTGGLGDLAGRGVTQLSKGIKVSVVPTVTDSWPVADPVQGNTPVFGEVANYRFCLSMLRALTLSHGMGVKISEETGKLNLRGPKVLSDEIVWNIHAYRTSIFDQDSPVRQTFTITIQATVRNVRFTMIRASAPTGGESVKLNLTAGLISDAKVLTVEGKTLNIPAMLPWTVANGSTMVEGSQLPGAAPLTGVPVSPSSTSVLLNVVGGVDPGKTITEALVANNQDAHLFTGGLIGNGPVRNVLGMNMVRENEALGVMLGPVPHDSNSLFIGPSLNAGIFTLGAGARLFGRDDGATSAKFAGILSVDLTRAFSRPPTPQAVAFSPNDPSSAFWKVFDKGLQNSALPTITLEMTGTTPSGPIQLVQVAGPDGAKITSGKTLVFPWVADGHKYTSRPVLPYGTYEFKLPAGVTATDVDGNVVRGAKITPNNLVFNFKLKSE